MHFLRFSLPGGSFGVPGGSFRCCWKCSGALGASLWVRVTSLGVPGGSFGGPWGSWSCSCEALGGHLGTFGGILGVLGRSWGVLGRACGRPSAPDVTHTDVSASPMLSMFFYTFFSFSDIIFMFLCVCSRPGGSRAALGKPCGSPGHA